MTVLKMDRSTFKAQTMAEAANHKSHYLNMTWQERLSVTAYLNSVAFKFDAKYPPRMNRTQFSAKSIRFNG